MQEKFTSRRKMMKTTLLSSLMALALLGAGNSSYGQAFCDDEVVYWNETFGTGTNPSPHPDIIPNSLTYQETGILVNEGTYRVINNSEQYPGWHNAPDHTANDTDGKMLVINGQSETFFAHTTTVPGGFAAGNYAASLYLMNVNTPGTCAPDPLLPLISFKVEYLDAGNNWVQLGNSPVSSNLVPQSATPTWVSLGGVFVLPNTAPFVVTQIKITLSDGISGGCGNDFAIDDIKLATCPSGSPVPVEFLQVSARQKGSGVNINWSTASEINNKHFIVERSADGSSNWLNVSTIPARDNGISQFIRKYDAYDPRPLNGSNFYRIRQVDNDGRYKFSSIAEVKINFTGIAVTVLNNPFSNVLNIDFMAERAQPLQCRLSDLSGKIVYQSTIVLQKGYNRKALNKFGTIASGLYLLQITDENGNLVSAQKLLKQ